MIKRKKQGKVRNATPIIIDNIHFKSKLEGYCYTKLKEAHIPTEYEPTHFTLLPAFTYDGENIRKMTYKPDFVGKNFIVECKGLITDSFPLRFKLFKRYLKQHHSTNKVYLVRNQKQVDEMIQEIINNK